MKSVVAQKESEEERGKRFLTVNGRETGKGWGSLGIQSGPANSCSGGKVLFLFMFLLPESTLQCRLSYGVRTDPVCNCMCQHVSASAWKSTSTGSHSHCF